MIVIYHFDNAFPFTAEIGVTPGWYIAVEFFFLVSGFLIARQAESGRYATATEFTLHRYRKLWPKYIAALALTFAAACYVTRPGWYEMLKEAIDSYWEILLLQGIGLDRGWDYISPTLWYISVMLIGGHFLYYLLRHHKKITEQMIAPAAVIVCYSYLYRHVGTLNTVVVIEDFYLNQALMRGLADMCLGIFSFMLYRRLQTQPERLKHIQWISPVIFISVILVSLKAGYTSLDFFFTLLFVPAVAMAFLPHTQTRASIFIEKWSGITYSIYLLHDIFRAWLFPKVFFTGNYSLAEKFKIMGGYMAAVTIAALVFDSIFMIVGRKRHEDSGSR